MTSHDPRSPAPSGGATRLLNRKVRLSLLALAMERAWRGLLWPFVAVALFVLVSLMGLWTLLPDWAHKTLLGAFAMAGLLSLAPLFRTRWPSRAEALRRLERYSGVPHRPASTYEDVLPSQATAEQTTLWAAHRARITRLIARLRIRLPHPRLDRRDPYALRAALLLLLAVAFLAAGGSSVDRLSAAFRFGTETPGAQFRLDAWITPPLYTGQPPIVLSDGRRLEEGTGQSIRQVTVPEKSLLLVRINSGTPGAGRLSVFEIAGTERTELKPANSDDSVVEYRSALKRSSTIEVRTPRQPVTTWRFDVVPDAKPKVALVGPPDRTPRGALRLNYRVEDDYGVIHAEARFALIGKDGKTVAPPTDASDEMAKLAAPPVIPLTLPRANAKVAEGRTYRDLTAHPWAGLKVRMTLIAKDQAGQEGRTKPIDMVLPARKFTKPLARAVVEQRRQLVLDPKGFLKVARALDALTFAADRFIQDKGVYLGLRTAYWRLHRPKGEAAVPGVVKQLWNVALRIEDGDLTDAERALRTAQEQLQKALEDGAPESEIKRLVEELRQALSRYLRAMAENARKRGLTASPEGLGNQRLMSSQDLEQMLRKIENLATTGSRDLARQMLSDLRDLLERLQAGTASRNSQTEQMMKMVEGLGDIINRQQKLLDDTFQERQRQSRRGRPGQGQQGQQGQGEGQQQRRGQGRGEGEGQGEGRGRYGSLGNRQAEILGRLDKLLEEMQRLGTKTPDQLEGAGRAMGEAEGALGEENLDRATQQQTLALDQLRQGTQSLAEQVLQTLSARMGRGGQGAKDPFGRPERTQGPDLGTSVKVPEEIDIQRAREILEELRRRLGEPTRPLLELDYLERLIRQF
ncbi:MAG: TIGR02302 family protein [Hyphomicrobiales bacterium]|nr:TIGR02302 family protein [Hyphomicrobiales bacterium]